jgi:hypothetical protein
MLPEPPAGTVGWIDEDGGILAMAGERSSMVSVVDLSYDELVETIELERDPDVGLRSMTFFRVLGDALCCLTEAELFALDGTGKLKWRLFHNDLTLTLLEVDGQEIVLESLLPDLDDSSRHTVVIDARKTASPLVSRSRLSFWGRSRSRDAACTPSPR